MKKKRMYEVDWNMGISAETKRKVSDDVPVIRTYEYMGKIVKVYEPRASFGLVSEGGNAVKGVNQTAIIFPAT